MKLNSLDAKISELECEISTDDDDISSASDIEIERDNQGNILKISSSLTKESILPLPSKYLPMSQCTKRKSDSKYQEQMTSNKKRKVVFADNIETQNKTSASKSKAFGLERTVKEMLKNYIPASQEKLPFYCRVCQFRGKNLEELNNHKLTELHKSASCIELKLTFCKVCKKQFTSPDQMSEHLKGKAHIERMTVLKLKQGKKFY